MMSQAVMAATMVPAVMPVSLQVIAPTGFLGGKRRSARKQSADRSSAAFFVAGICSCCLGEATTDTGVI